MKKLLLFTLLVAMCSPVFGQLAWPDEQTVFYSTGSSDWVLNSTWVKGTYTGGDPAYLEDVTYDVQPYPAAAANSYPGYAKNFPITSNVSVPAGEFMPNIVVIRSGHTVVLTEEVYFSGYIIIEAGAVLQFNKVNSEKGRLIMNSPYVGIDLRWGDGNPASGDIINVGNGLAADFLSINGKKVNGHWVNTLPSPLAELVDDKGYGVNIVITSNFLICMTNDYNHGHVWTLADLYAILKCAGQEVTLPVELTAYNARALGQQVEVSWEAVKEWDFSHYVVEWSTDGNNFSEAATVAAKGTAQGRQQYSFRHTPGFAGTVYYRLLAVDIDGTVEDKGTKMVRIGAEVFQVYAGNGRVMINYNGPSNSQVLMYDTSGRVIRNVALTTEGIQTAGIRPGMYLVQISNSLEKKVQRVVIQ